MLLSDVDERRDAALLPALGVAFVAIASKLAEAIDASFLATLFLAVPPGTKNCGKQNLHIENLLATFHTYGEGLVQLWTKRLYGHFHRDFSVTALSVTTEYIANDANTYLRPPSRTRPQYYSSSLALVCKVVSLGATMHTRIRR